MWNIVICDWNLKYTEFEKTNKKGRKYDVLEMYKGYPIV